MYKYIFLPIYKKSYDLLLEIFMITKHFSREYKYSLGDSLKKEVINLIVNIFKINNDRKKSWEVFFVAQENIEKIRLYFRLLKDLKQINLKRFVSINEMIESVSKQLAYWQKSSGQNCLTSRLKQENP